MPSQQHVPTADLTRSPSRPLSEALAKTMLKQKHLDRSFCSLYSLIMESSSSPKDRILQTAIRLFYEQGYSQTGINQILSEANVARASLYQHFGSKESLGMEYLKQIRKDWFQKFNEFLAQVPNPEARLLATFDALRESMESNQYLGCRFLNLLADIQPLNPAMREEIMQHKSLLRNRFRDLLQEHCGAEPLSAAQQKLGDFIYIVFEGAICEAKVYQSTWPIDQAQEMIKQLLSKESLE